eukprot:2245257-Pyramimonas_sp.AAC.1
MAMVGPLDFPEPRTLASSEIPRFPMLTEALWTCARECALRVGGAWGSERKERQFGRPKWVRKEWVQCPTTTVVPNQQRP